MQNCCANVLVVKVFALLVMGAITCYLLIGWVLMRWVLRLIVAEGIAQILDGVNVLEWPIRANPRAWLTSWPYLMSLAIQDKEPTDRDLEYFFTCG